MENKNRTIDYLIIGQGLAGSILAWQLLKHKKHVLIVDNGRDDSASRVAAGIVNPLAGQRLVKHPATDAHLENARAFYAGIEDYFEQFFYFERPMIRLFGSGKEQKYWTERQSDPEYSEYLGEGFRASQYLEIPANRIGGFHQKHCGFLDTCGFLDAIRNHFMSNDRLFETEFDWNALFRQPAVYVWNDCKIRNIVCCEGYCAIHNPFFSWLPFQLSKGEIATFESDTDLPESIVNRGKWILPTSPRQFKCGSTYELRTLDTKPSAHAHEVLRASAGDLLLEKTGFRLLTQEAGIRPGTLDKNPFIGMHPEHPRIGIFNGFGSKGVLSIPYYADLFVAHLLNKQPLPKEIAVGRYPIDDAPG